MRIGIDFDNTIVDYDRVFHKVAMEGGHIPADLAQSKILVRDHLRRAGKEDVWTEMQGLVYGTRMHEADIYAGFIQFLTWARERHIETCIISHKTRYPFLGRQHDLHEAARNWTRDSLTDGAGPLVPLERVHFEPTKQAKLARVMATRCDYFIDDLPEILSDSAFPPATQRILFDPEGHHEHAVGDWVRLRGWDEIREYLGGRWAPTH